MCMFFCANDCICVLVGLLFERVLGIKFWHVLCRNKML